MPRLKKATDANGITFYPVTISKGVWDTDRGQKMSKSIDDLHTILDSLSLDDDTGELVMEYTL